MHPPERAPAFPAYPNDRRQKHFVFRDGGLQRTRRKLRPAFSAYTNDRKQKLFVLWDTRLVCTRRKMLLHFRHTGHPWP